MPGSPEKTAPKWINPADVMKLHKLKQRKKLLQSRIAGNVTKTPNAEKKEAFEDVFCARKRKNPFLSDGGESKKNRIEPTAVLEESADQTLFKLLNHTAPNNITNDSITSFNNILNKINAKEEIKQNVEIVKAQGEKWLPIDWGLKSKARLLSEKPFPWSQKLKISEEASGVTGFTRCLDTNCETKLDTSPNARFHQCCLLWQQPSLPWVNLFPRTTTRATAAGASLASNSFIRDSLQAAWSDSLRSLFQLIRTRQCPYFYACANSFTVLFRAAGICGHSEVHALVTPTTRGFRHILKQEDIEFTMPLKKKRFSDVGYETQDSEESVSREEEEAPPDEQWMKSMGINAEDIKQINYTQERLLHKAECKVDNSDESLILIEGVEVHAFYNFLINCKSTTATTGPLAGIPPTLLAPVAYHGATLTSLKVRENKVHIDDADYYSLDLSGPILPSMIHNLFAINPPEHSVTISFNNIASTNSFSKFGLVEADNKPKEGNSVFIKENLADCGLNDKVLEHFANPDNKHITNVDCIKYISDNKTYTWT